MTKSLGLSLVALLATGCSLAATPWRTQGSREYALPYLERTCLAEKQKQTVTLLDAGAEPRKPLRFFPREDLEASLAIFEAPEFTDSDVTLTLETIGKGASGQTCYRFFAQGAHPEPDKDADNPIVGVLRIGSHGDMGLATDALDVHSYAAERDLFWALVLAQPRLPSEPVGIGARWRFRARGRRGGELFALDFVYELVERNGSRVELAVDRHIVRPAQDIQGPRGFAMSVDELDSYDLGRLELDLVDAPLASFSFYDEAGKPTVSVRAGYR